MTEQRKQNTESDTKRSGEELTRQWVRSITADAVVFSRVVYPDFAHQVMQSIARDSRPIPRGTASEASVLPSRGNPRLRNRCRVHLATRIFTEYGSAIRAMIRPQVGTNQEEDDVYQNLYLSLVRNPPPWPRANILAHLNTVLRNDIIDAVRQRRNEQNLFSRYVLRQVRSKTGASPNDPVTQAQESRCIRDWLARRLPVHEATALIERYVYGYRTMDVALHVRAKRKTVCQFVRDALRRVREVVSKNLG